MTPPVLPFRWNRLESGPLNLAITLTSGQAFRWRQNGAGVWSGVIGQTAYALWQQANAPDSPLYWQSFPEAEVRTPLQDYLRLDTDLDALYADWIAAEPRIADATRYFRGLRILRQPPEECFFAFQCAACNTVVKIERSVRKLAERYGEPIAVPAAVSPEPLYTFPTIAALSDADESVLRGDLWGYRAPRVIALARHLAVQPANWLASLRTAPYETARDELSRLHGIGTKLADCICLFSLDKDEATPVDTHVRQIATRLFLPELEGKSLTPRIYAALADAYRQRFGASAGWAQQYLFFAELPRSRS